MNSTSDRLIRCVQAARLVGLALAVRKRNRFFWRRSARDAFEKDDNTICFHYQMWVFISAEDFSCGPGLVHLSKISRGFIHHSMFTVAMKSLSCDLYNGRSEDEFSEKWKYKKEGHVLSALSARLIFDDDG